jgi:hypothetical protein
MSRSIKGSLELVVVLGFLLLIVCNLVLNPMFCAAGTSDEASTKMVEADRALQEAFKKVLVAEEAGANVADSISKLNEAGQLLTKAEIAYGNGDISEAVENANSSILIANAVENDALTMEASAEANGQRALWQSLMLSLVWVSVFIITLLIVWKKFNHNWNRRLSAMKPEVPSDVDD